MTTIEELDRMGTYLAALVARLRLRAEIAESVCGRVVGDEKVAALAEARTLHAVAVEIDRDRAATDKRRLNLREGARPTGPSVTDPQEWKTPLVGDQGGDNAHRLAEALGDPVDVATERMLRTPTEQKVFDDLEPERNDRIRRDIAWSAFHEESA